MFTTENSNIELGKLGEKKAVQHLKSQNYQILTTNYRTKSGEIDIICKDKDCVVFVEVKTRRNQNYGQPMEAVNYYKQQHMIAVAKDYIYKIGYEFECRFDVIEVFINHIFLETARINHIKNVIS